MAEAGPLDLLLTVRSDAASAGSSGPELEVEFSGGQVHLMTCADSLVALRDIIVYLASDGDFGSSGCAGYAESRPQATPLSVSMIVVCQLMGEGASCSSFYLSHTLSH